MKAGGYTERSVVLIRTPDTTGKNVAAQRSNLAGMNIEMHRQVGEGHQGIGAQVSQCSEAVSVFKPDKEPVL